ncbi:hypothetical protein INT46_000701 [Mucor plumbeus]|uniref:Uncharacterized protein n=1 Tax=Mucor plumbeus TaxID=97098 RepID=A0A8H7QN05_9FUNG|nr:hypothetical protein INT46_000701 [Mucor plumbeus]
MWPTSIVFSSKPGISFSTLVIWIVFDLAMLFLFFRSPVYHNPISYSALVAALTGTISSIFSILSSFGFSSNQPAFYIFYGLYTTYTFIPLIGAFYINEKKSKYSELGKYSVFLGFVWAAVCILASLAVTIMAAIANFQDYGSESADIESLVRFSDGIYFMLLMGWGFILVNLLLISIYYKKLTEKNSRRSLVIFTFLNMFSTITFTILAFAPLKFEYSNFDVFGYLNIFLVDFPVILAVFTAFYLGHLWKENQQNAIITDAIDDNAHNSSKYEIQNNV